MHGHPIRRIHISSQSAYLHTSRFELLENPQKRRSHGTQNNLHINMKSNGAKEGFYRRLWEGSRGEVELGDEKDIGNPAPAVSAASSEGKQDPVGIVSLRQSSGPSPLTFFLLPFCWGVSLGRRLSRRRGGSRDAVEGNPRGAEDGEAVGLGARRDLTLSPPRHGCRCLLRALDLRRLVDLLGQESIPLRLNLRVRLDNQLTA